MSKGGEKNAQMSGSVGSLRIAVGGCQPPRTVLRAGGRARTWLGLLLPFITLASNEYATEACRGHDNFCGFVHMKGRMDLRRPVPWLCGRRPAGAFLASRMQQSGRRELAPRGVDGMNELERAREALADIIARRKGQSLGSGTSTSTRISAPGAPAAAGDDASALETLQRAKPAAPETLGAKMAATFPPRRQASSTAVQANLREAGREGGRREEIDTGGDASAPADRDLNSISGKDFISSTSGVGVEAIKDTNATPEIDAGASPPGTGGQQQVLGLLALLVQKQKY